MLVFLLLLLFIVICQASTIARQSRKMSSQRRALDALKVLWEGK